MQALISFWPVCGCTLYETIRKLAPALPYGQRERGYFEYCCFRYRNGRILLCAHHTARLFTVIILPCVTLGLALWFHPLFAAVLLPVYLIVSVIFPLIAVRAGRDVGMRYRTRLGEMKSLVLESVYGLKDIQIFGFGLQRMEQVREKNCEIKPCCPWPDHSQANSFLCAYLFCVSGKDTGDCGSILAGCFRSAEILLEQWFCPLWRRLLFRLPSLLLW